MNSLPQDSNPYKQCSKCPNSYPATEEFFCRRKKGATDGLRSECKVCTKEYQRQYHQENKEEISKIVQEYRDENRDAILEQRKHHYTTNKDRILLEQKEYYRRNHRKAIESRKAYHYAHRSRNLAQMREYRRKNLDILRLKERAYDMKNKDKRRNSQKAYFQTERGKVVKRASESKRRAQKKAVGGSYTSAQLQEQLNRQKYKCYWCSGKFGKGKGAWHADHVVPLSKGGTNNIDNIVAACPLCNLRKGNKLVHEWTDGGRLL